MSTDIPAKVLTAEKKKKRRSKKKSHPTMEKPQESKASQALKTDLRNRLKTRIKMCSVSRLGGTSQDVQNVLKKFNDGDEEKLELMKDIQEDVKGMKQKDAKKYLKQVISGMNTDQTDTFVNMVQDKLPSQSSNIVNYVKRQKKIQETETKSKPQVNPETVYTPTRLMTEEEKIRERARRRMVSNHTPETPEVISSSSSTLPIKKKKKGFSKIQIDIPKITELRDHPTVSTESKTPSKSNTISLDSKSEPLKKKKTFTSNPIGAKSNIESINKIFPDVSTGPPKDEMKRLAYPLRLQNIQGFHIRHMEKQREQYLFEAGTLVEVVKVISVEKLPLPQLLPVPESEEFVAYDTIPPKFKHVLDQNDFDYEAFDATESWAYRKIRDNLNVSQLNMSSPTDDSHPRYVKFRNAHSDCVKFLPKLTVVVHWLSALRNKKVPLQWLCEVLNNLGIMRQKTENPRSSTDKTWKECFRVLCEEYRDKQNTKITVPIVPFLRITFQC
jgi:hypothetical protein